MSRAEGLRESFLLAGEAAPVRVLPAWDGAPAPAPARDLPAAAIAIGAFDGVHRGHRHLLDRAVADARARGARAVAVTFDPDPDEVLPGRPAPKLLARADRLSALARSGVDEVLCVPFTPGLARLDHGAFFADVLGRSCDVRSVHVGEDFRLGAHGASTVPVIRAWGAARGIEVTGHRLVSEATGPGEGPQAITATRIRAAVARGDVALAARLLGRPHLVRGTVVHGRGDGTGLGFPTANVDRAERLQMPADGVYAGWVLARGTAYPAAINVGVPPMFADDPASASLESVLLGFSGDLYGAEVETLFLERLRGPVRFESLDALVSAVRANIEDVRARLGGEGVAL